ncbi:MAG: hypothetical protein WCP39_06665 [Chlamydiota bacterium]
MKIFLPFLLCAPLLWGSVTQPLTLEAGAGYTYDRMNEKALTNTGDETLVYEEKYTNHVTQTILTLRTIQRDFFALATAGYGYLGHKDMEQRWGTQNLLFSPDTRYTTQGHNWQTLGLIGYAVNVIPEHFHKFIITPVGGFGGFWKNISRHSPHPNPDSSNNSTLYPGQLEKRTKDVWYGPTLGIIFEGDPWHGAWVRVGYSFYGFKIHHKTFARIEEKRYTDGSLTLDHIITLKEKLGTGKGSGHFGQIQFIYELSKHWQVAVLSEIHYFYSDKKRHMHKTQWTETIFPSESVSEIKGKDKFHARWYTLSFLGEIAYRF